MALFIDFSANIGHFSARLIIQNEDKNQDNLFFQERISFHFSPNLSKYTVKMASSNMIDFSNASGFLLAPFFFFPRERHRRQEDGWFLIKNHQQSKVMKEFIFRSANAPFEVVVHNGK